MVRWKTARYDIMPRKNEWFRFMFVLKETTFIQSSDEVVYNAVSQLDTYQQWNPWVIHCTNGDAGVGEFSDVTVRLGNKTMRVKHEIVERTPYSRFVWCDTGWFTVFAFGQRERNIRVMEGGVDYEVILTITGPLSFVAKWMYGKQLEAGLRDETRGLKEYCEQKK